LASNANAEPYPSGTKLTSTLVQTAGLLGKLIVRRDTLQMSRELTRWATGELLNELLCRVENLMDNELGFAEMLQPVANKVIKRLLWPVYIN
jgi:hypothetical protein